ncbi:NAD(P)-binding protein [Aspergillus cavernicola]|uniref:NAD(P)-binding protein n=1 Tax=Aspergillus cavernicola TaxID=176166 RepID=A0ABR4I791_9EURO
MSIMPATYLTRGVTFVTGGARGLGNAVAVSFAKAGATGVVLVDIQGKEAMAEGAKNVESHGVECLTIQADVSKETDVENAVAQAVSRFGRIDYAANFAGIGGQAGSIANYDVDNFRRVMDVNVTGSLLCMKYQMKQMLQQDPIAMHLPDSETGRVPQRGSIVNCASVNSIMASAYSAAYTASKHAVAGLTKVAALEGRQHHIRVNTVSPGFLYTQLISNGLGPAGEAGETKWTELEARQGRSATFDEIGDAVVLLSSPRMSLLNAHNLVVDNGFTVNEMSS